MTERCQLATCKWPTRRHGRLRLAFPRRVFCTTSRSNKLFHPLPDASERHPTSANTPHPNLAQGHPSPSTPGHNAPAHCCRRRNSMPPPAITTMTTTCWTPTSPHLCLDGMDWIPNSHLTFHESPVTHWRTNRTDPTDRTTTDPPSSIRRPAWPLS